MTTTQAPRLRPPRIEVVRRLPRPPAVSYAGLPWPVTALFRLVLTNLIAAAVMAFAWYRASNRGTVGAELPWLDLAVVGAIVAGVGDCGWLLRGRRAVGEQRRALLRIEPVASAASGVVAPSARPAAEPASAQLVRGVGMARIHRADCPLALGKDVQVVRKRGGLPACGICAP